MRHFATLTIIALTCAAAPAAHAQTFYTTLSAYNAAATTTTTYNFEGIAPAGGTASNPAVLVTPASGRVTFVVSGGDDPAVVAVDSGFFSGDFRLSDGSDTVAAGRPSSSASTTRINLESTVTAFAIDYGMELDVANTFSFALFNNDTQVGSTNNAGSAGGDRFFGATSATPFNNVRATAAVVSNFRYVVFDNARVGSAGTAVVPEAGTLALLLPALGVLGVVVRRKVRVH